MKNEAASMAEDVVLPRVVRHAEESLKRDEKFAGEHAIALKVLEDYTNGLIKADGDMSLNDRFELEKVLTKSFVVDEDHYIFMAPPGIVFDVDKLRRERHQLVGEMTVRCALPGAINGVLTVGDFNFNSTSARDDRSKFLTRRVRTYDDGLGGAAVDWLALLEEFCQRVLAEERTGRPAVNLRELPREPREEIKIDGLLFPRRHPSILFGDGGSAKSYTALYVAGKLAKKGMRIGLFDWELAGEDHRDRLELLFGAHMPDIWYRRCARPLVAEADSLRRIAREQKLDYAIYDSVVFACDGKPEDAEVAGRYFQAVRQIGVGSLHIAHVNKSEDNDRKPFGSSFWHNGCRCSWYLQAVEQTGDDKTLRLGFFNRKANLGPIQPPVSYAVCFTDNSTTFLPANVADSPDLASKLSVKTRMLKALKHGSMTTDEIAKAIDAVTDTVDRTARRYKDSFIFLSGGRIGLVHR